MFSWWCIIVLKVIPRDQDWTITLTLQYQYFVGVEIVSMQPKGTFNKHTRADFSTSGDLRRSVIAMPSISDEDIELRIEETGVKVQQDN